MRDADAQGRLELVDADELHNEESLLAASRD